MYKNIQYNLLYHATYINESHQQNTDKHIDNTQKDIKNNILYNETNKV